MTMGRAILKMLIPLAFIAVISLNFVRELKVINVASRIEGGSTYDTIMGTEKMKYDAICAAVA